MKFDFDWLSGFGIKVFKIVDNDDTGAWVYYNLVRKLIIWSPSKRSASIFRNASLT